MTSGSGSVVRVEYAESLADANRSLEGAHVLLADRLTWEENEHSPDQWTARVWITGVDQVFGNCGHSFAPRVEARALAFACLLACVADPDMNTAAATAIDDLAKL